MAGLIAGALGTTDEMEEVFGDHAFIAAALAFEVALAEAQAELGLVPAAAAAAIRAAADADGFDAAALAREGRRAGAFPIPFVRRLTARVAAADAAAAAWVHYGATSQDVVDTATALQMREGLALIGRDGRRLADGLAALAGRQAATPMLGRTLMQPGPPVTFGLKAANWLLGVVEALERLEAEKAGALELQLGGATGTLAVMGEAGPEVAARMAARLGLALPAMPWHTRRDGVAGLAAALGILTGATAKMARDVSLLMQFEVGEAREPGGAGRGGSSTMPHKRNPTASMIALAAAARTPGLVATVLAGMVQEHERAVGGWQAEAPTIAALFAATHAALVAMVEVAEGLVVDEARIGANIAALDGLVFAERLMTALAPALGRSEAHHLAETLVKEAVAGRRGLAEVAAADPRVRAHLDAGAIGPLFDPAGYLGSAGRFVAEALARYRAAASLWNRG
ncbi:3-carboxy-cis,cis-muconate cycloisomerase [Chelatococcus sp. SYSU_G07232]|uniref:3-carboxy-cis,cis-muconate cycloisomerase n=1 Tax=Chelatococcus albus TaxID=3047466 RepID=A0ABT7AIE8_9HYPH|nr:3-carboxy-cis,cis-muconate cycloisomerase [Chelatococcus sp. SYSU_G07232]MDJ1159155.1 3-carboxy-cis,cis-muconate cycloisomerase [Chelatococcus sp. SYSU_G07232]